jgi:asparagine synthase (glutamine-hydrolysing)
MCGIAGVISKKPVDKNDIMNMTSALYHRGPDAQGTYINHSQTVALGHTRLSIIDLRSESNQPFFSANGRYVLVFNGEIYNFKKIRRELCDRHSVDFKTSSDTEVIAEAFSVWGSEMVNKLDGMFAIAIFDQQSETIYLFRDRIGKKPIYYFLSSTCFVFASEIKALLRYGGLKSSLTLNKPSISTFLHLGYIPEPDTIYTEVKKFPSGNWGQVDSCLQLTLQPYWRVEDHLQQMQVLDQSEAKKNLIELLDSAVEERMISDVPIGAFLSGGTDSSIITAIASRHVAKPLKTFCIGFKDREFDESKYARQVAKALGTDHTEYILSEQEALSLLDVYINHFDEPFADTSAIPTMLVSQLAKKEVTVALTGDGGDELFQGYGAYTWANRLDQRSIKLLKSWLRMGLILSGKSKLQRVSHLLEEVQPGQIRSHIFSQEQYLFTQREIQQNLFVDSNMFVPFVFNDSLRANKLTCGERQALFDLQFYLKDDLLVKVDRASMYSALECRSPLLDHRIIEFAISLDHTLKIRGKKNKWILKELLRKFLPDELIDRPKWGFSVPLTKWLKSDLKFLIDSFLNDQIIEDAGLFKAPYINTLKKEFFAGKDYLYNRLWVLILVHKWLKEIK